MLMRIMAVPRKSGRLGGVAVSVVEYVIYKESSNIAFGFSYLI